MKGLQRAMRAMRDMRDMRAMRAEGYEAMKPWGYYEATMKLL